MAKKTLDKSYNLDYEEIIKDVARYQSAVQDIPKLVRQELQKGWKQLPNTEAARSPKAWFFDPLSLQYSLGYKDRRFSLTYDTLKRIAQQLSIVSAIINTRCSQVAAFSEPYRKTRSLGFEIRHKDPDHATTAAEVAFIKELENFVVNCGRSEPNPFSRVKRDDFDSFLRKIVRDSLLFDQVCAEVIPDRLGIPYEFLAIDSSTVRFASDSRYVGINSSYTEREGFVPSVPTRFSGLYEGSQYGTRTSSGDLVSYVQIVNGQIENVYSDRELIFGVRNPRTDIYTQGYGYGELEQLITIVTSHLYAEEWNRKQFCVDGSTLINTDLGLVTVKELVNKEFKVWDGKSFNKAIAFETKVRPKVKTKLWNGLALYTSPEHKFKVISYNGTNSEWKEQKDLNPGDCALIGYKKYDCRLDESLLLVGKEYKTDRKTGRDWIPTSDLIKDDKFWEMVGFALGDGYWPNLKSTKYEETGITDPQWMEIFPHHEMDRDLFDKFMSVCKKYGINSYIYTKNPSTERSDGNFGYPVVKIGHKTFLQWLFDLGFKPSCEERRIPDVFYKLPAHIRCSILRGLFSADGHRHKHTKKEYCTPTLFSSYTTFREDIVSLLWSVGVSSNEIGIGNNRNGEIDVQDIAAFVDNIGYLQEYKNRDINREEKTKYSWDVIHRPTAVLLSQSVREHKDWLSLSKLDRDLICKVSREKSGLSRPRAHSILNKLNMDIPEALLYHHVPIDISEKVSDETELVQMYDVEVFSDDHMFLANGILVHNSQGAAPKGILNLKGDNWTPEQLEGFKRQWQAQVSGVENSWRTPILQSEGLEWIDLHRGNAEMEFGKWMEYLLKVVCGVYLIDPAELNFAIQGGVSQTPLFESSQEWKLKASRDKGLKPLLKFISRLINKNIIDRIDSHFTFEFIGLDELTEEEKHELMVEKLSSYLTLNEVRRGYDLPELPGGDTPLNPVYLEAIRMQNEMQMQQQQQEQLAQQQQQLASAPAQAQLPAPQGANSMSEPLYSENYSFDSKKVV